MTWCLRPWPVHESRIQAHAQEAGAGLVTTEMVSAMGLALNHGKTSTTSRATQMKSPLRADLRFGTWGHGQRV